jgi:hypothetical protein
MDMEKIQVLIRFILHTAFYCRLTVCVIVPERSEWELFYTSVVNASPALHQTQCGASVKQPGESGGGVLLFFRSLPISILPMFFTPLTSPFICMLGGHLLLSHLLDKTVGVM